MEIIFFIFISAFFRSFTLFCNTIESCLKIQRKRKTRLCSKCIEYILAEVVIMAGCFDIKVCCKIYQNICAFSLLSLCMYFSCDFLTPKAFPHLYSLHFCCAFLPIYVIWISFCFFHFYKNNL